MLNSKVTVLSAILPASDPFQELAHVSGFDAIDYGSGMPANGVPHFGTRGAGGAADDVPKLGEIGLAGRASGVVLSCFLI
jgi:hypothetical protein